jgi:hypothetical protein
MTYLCPITIAILLGGFCVAICAAVQDGIVRLKRLHQIPCTHCAFFTGDYRLKCTVHPCKALSEEAIDCLDYESASHAQGNHVSKGCCTRKDLLKNNLPRLRSCH